MPQYVDWDLAASTAALLGKSGPPVSYAEATRATADLRSMAGEAVSHVSEVTMMHPVTSSPPSVSVVDRADWAAANAAGLRAVMNPLTERMTKGRVPPAAVTTIGSRVTGLQIGAVLAYLSGKVLGQYEIFADEPGQLLLVAPNIVEAERKLEVDPRDFRLWVCLHEATHQLQFMAVPWIRGYFLGEIGALADASQLDGGQLMERLRRGASALVRAVQDPDTQVSLFDLVQTPGQRAVFDRLTALMTLLEGHAEYVMDAAGATVVPTVDEIRARFNRRRATANPMERVIRKLLGIEIKLRQYAEGRAFVHQVIDAVGMTGFNAVWQSPLTLPRRDELTDPDAWVTRVHGTPA